MLQKIMTDSRVPKPNYVVSTSPAKFQTLWKVQDFSIGQAETLQRTMAAEFGADRAVVDIAKLRDYCLNPDHEDGKHKARVFASALGLRQGDADWLRGCLLEAAVSEQAIMILKNRFGTLYVIDFLLKTSSRSAIVRSCWIVRIGEDFPRLTTCYVRI